MKTFPLALAAALAAPACFAQTAPRPDLARPEPARTRPPFPGPGGGRGWAARADADGDGVVTRDEAMAQAAARFARADANGDGRLDAAEQAARPPRGARGDAAPGSPE